MAAKRKTYKRKTHRTPKRNPRGILFTSPDLMARIGGAIGAVLGHAYAENPEMFSRALDDGAPLLIKAVRNYEREDVLALIEKSRKRYDARQQVALADFYRALKEGVHERKNFDYTADLLKGLRDYAEFMSVDFQDGLKEGAATPPKKGSKR